MHDVDSHFVGRSGVVRAIYDRILEVSAKCGQIHEDAKKTSIHLNRRYAFAGIQTQSSAVVLTVKSTKDIESERIMKSERASANRWYHYIKLTSPDDVDAQVEEWIRASYEISG